MRCVDVYIAYLIQRGDALGKIHFLNVTQGKRLDAPDRALFFERWRIVFQNSGEAKVGVPTLTRLVPISLSSLRRRLCDPSTRINCELI